MYNLKEIRSKLKVVEREIKKLEEELFSQKMDKMLLYIELMKQPEVRAIYKKNMDRAWKEVKELLEE